MDPRDLIDPDEGRELVQRAFFVEGEPCENCGSPCLEGRVHVPGFDFFGCNDCAEEAKAVIFAEQNCPVLADAIQRAKNVQQVRQAMKQHESTCPSCNPKLRKPAKIAELPAVPGERKEAA